MKLLSRLPPRHRLRKKLQRMTEWLACRLPVAELAAVLPEPAALLMASVVTERAALVPVRRTAATLAVLLATECRV
jgi:hypothetical protein